MATFSMLIDTLKHELRVRQIRYRDIAKKLDMSEANVKRMFSSGNLTTERVDQICDLMDLDISDLVSSHEAMSEHIDYLSIEQEQELVNNVKLLLVAVCVRNYMTMQEIVSRYELSEPECISLLARLDRMRLITLLPKNRIQLQLSEHFRWQTNGPIVKYFERHIQKEFLDSSFSDEGERRYLLSGRFTQSARDALLKKLETFKKDFENLHKEESTIPVSQKQNLGILLAFRPWEFSAFENVRRKG